MSAMEIAKSGAKLVSDTKLVFSRNPGCALADFYGHYSPRGLHVGLSDKTASAWNCRPSRYVFVRFQSELWAVHKYQPYAPSLNVYTQ